MEIDITGLPKNAVLAALFNGARAQGRGFLHYNPQPMTPEVASRLLQQRANFDYLQGRVLKVDLSEDSFDCWLYDRDNGEGAAFMVIRVLRESGNPADPRILMIHERGIDNARRELEEYFAEKSQK